MDERPRGDHRFRYVGIAAVRAWNSTADNKCEKRARGEGWPSLAAAALVAVRYARLADEKNQARWNKKRQKKRTDANSWWNEEGRRSRLGGGREGERGRDCRRVGGQKGRWVASNARMKGPGRTMENQDEGSLTWPRAIESKQSGRSSFKISLAPGNTFMPVVYIYIYIRVRSTWFLGGVCRGHGVCDGSQDQRDCLVNTVLERWDHVWLESWNVRNCLLGDFSPSERWWNGHFSVSPRPNATEVNYLLYFYILR